MSTYIRNPLDFTLQIGENINISHRVCNEGDVVLSILTQHAATYLFRTHPKLKKPINKAMQYSGGSGSREIRPLSRWARAADVRTSRADHVSGPPRTPTGPATREPHLRPARNDQQPAPRPSRSRLHYDPGYMSRKIRKFRANKFGTWNKRKFWLMWPI